MISKVILNKVEELERYIRRGEINEDICMNLNNLQVTIYTLFDLGCIEQEHAMYLMNLVEYLAEKMKEEVENRLTTE